MTDQIKKLELEQQIEDYKILLDMAEQLHADKIIKRIHERVRIIGNQIAELRRAEDKRNPEVHY